MVNQSLFRQTHCDIGTKQLGGGEVGVCTDYGRDGCLMVSVLVSVSSGLGSSLGRGHCAVFLGKTPYSQGASLHPGPGCSKAG